MEFYDKPCSMKTIEFDSIPSTQQWSSENLNLLIEQHGITLTNWVRVIAKLQTGAIGQLKTRTKNDLLRTSAFNSHECKKWVDRETNLKVSYVFAWPKALVGKSHLISLICAYSIMEMLDRKYHIASELKWINDICCHGKKIAGILVWQTTKLDTEDFTYIIVGIGLNVNADATVLDTMSKNMDDACPITSLKCELFPEESPQIHQVLDSISSYFYQAIQKYISSSQTFQVVQSYLNSHLYNCGKRVRFANAVGREGDSLITTTGRDHLEGIILGLDQRDGYLKVRDICSGEIIYIVHGHMTFSARPLNRLI